MEVLQHTVNNQATSHGWRSALISYCLGLSHYLSITVLLSCSVKQCCCMSHTDGMWSLSISHNVGMRVSH